MKDVMADTKRGNAALPIIAGTSIFAGVGLVLGWAAYMRRYVRHNLPLTAALDGALRWFDTNAGRVAYYESGNPSNKKTAPLVLIHRINAAASAYEMKPLFDHYAPGRRVYALDLPGYGFAKASKKEVKAWQDVLKGYLRGRPGLTRAFVLIDCRHPAQQIDLEFIRWLETTAAPFALIFTKADKLGPVRLQENIAAYKQVLSAWRSEMPDILVSSAQKGTGRGEILGYIAAKLAAHAA